MVGCRSLKPRIMVRIHVPQFFCRIKYMKQIFDVLIISLVMFLLLKGSDFLMTSAVSIAEKFKLSKLVIASTLVAIGTGLPSIAVNITYILMGVGYHDAIIGSAIGTNFLNIGIGLGIPAIILPLKVKYEVFKKEIPLFLAICMLLGVFLIDDVITRIEGLILLLMYALTLYIIYQYAKRERPKESDEEEIDLNTSTISHTPIIKYESNVKIIARLAFGFALLIGSAVSIVYMTPILSRDFGVSQYILGATIVAVGPSIPMIFTSIRSALKGYTDIVVGNVFGGTIANIALGIGLVTVINPLTVSNEAISDVYFFAIVVAIMLSILLPEGKPLGRSNIFNRVSGIIIVVLYFVYLLSKFL